MACNGCNTGSCGRMGVYDWLENIAQPGADPAQNLVEVRFKGIHKGFYQNANKIDFITGDTVATEGDRGFDVGLVTMSGELAKLQAKKKKTDLTALPKILRVATNEDIKKLENSRSRELSTLSRSREIIKEIRLRMKMSDVEYQADGTRATFYYTADDRVDFRELIKTLAQEFKIRVEMKQIGLRQEAGVVGGVGSCGRELCCSAWLTDFQTINTSSARLQNLSINPLKITGLCGKLKCCLNYELETYLDALKDIPNVQQIETELGIAKLQKTDIFKKQLFFSYEDDSNWVMLSAAQVIELQKLNKQGIKPPSLTTAEEDKKIKDQQKTEKQLDFVDVVGQSNLHKRNDNRNKKPNPNRSQNRPQNQNQPQKRENFNKNDKKKP